MNILIIYSEKKNGNLLLLLSRLKEKDIHAFVLAFPTVWMIDDSQKLLYYLKKSTHSLFMIDEQDRNHPFFIFSFGYCVGAHEKPYLFDVDKDCFPVFLADYLQYVQKLDEAIDKIQAEKVRFQAFLARLEAKKQLIKDGFDIAKGALVEAVEEGKTQAVELFLKTGFLPDQTDKHAVPLLCLAVRNNHFDVLEVLLRYGANVNTKSHDRENTPLMDAAAKGNSQMVQALINHGAELNSQSRDGQTALILAIGQGDEVSARLLIEAGADAFIMDKLGMNALLYAQLFGKKAILELIEQHKK